MKINPLLIINTLSPLALLEGENQTHLLRGRVLISLSLLYLASLSFLSIVFATLALLKIVDLWAVVISSSISSSCYILQLIYFKRSGNLFFAANVGMLTMYSATVVFIAITGGWESPVTMILMCTSVCAFLMEGKKSGIFWSGLIALAYGIFFIIQQRGIHLQSVVEQSLQDYLVFGSWLYSWTIIFGGMAIYGGLARTLNESLAVERERLHSKATYDSATGAYNRSAFYQLLNNRVKHVALSHSEFLYLDIGIAPVEYLDRDTEEDLLIKVIRALEGYYPCRMVVARGGGLSLLILIDEVNQSVMASETAATVLNILMSALDGSHVEVSIGAVMVPAYSNNAEEVVAAGQKAMQEAKKKADQYILYTDAQRMRYEKWSEKNWLRRRYSDFSSVAALLR